LVILIELKQGPDVVIFATGPAPNEQGLIIIIQVVHEVHDK